MIKRQLVRATLAAVLVVLPAMTAHAQRFEGIITMKLSGGNIGAAMGGRGDGRGGPGRGGPGRGSVSRGADAAAAGGRAGGRAGESRGGEARAAVGRGGAGGRGDEAQAEAMRAAFSGGLQQIEYMSRRGKIRIAVVGASGAPSPAAMIYVPDDGVMYTLLPPLSMYMETALADMQANISAQTADSASRLSIRAPTVTHTKQFELVAGHKCEHIIVSQGKQKSDICMAKGLGAFIMPAGIGRAEGWDRVMSEANGFPLKVLDANGTVAMEVTRIERKALPEALFSVPDTYSKMPDMTRRPPE